MLRSVHPRTNSLQPSCTTTTLLGATCYYSSNCQAGLAVSATYSSYGWYYAGGACAGAVAQCSSCTNGVCPSPTPAPTGCSDTDYAHTDSTGEKCFNYKAYRDQCGHYDTDKFHAIPMCCACGGGRNFLIVPTPLPTPPHVAQVSSPKTEPMYIHIDITFRERFVLGLPKPETLLALTVVGTICFILYRRFSWASAS